MDDPSMDPCSNKSGCTWTANNSSEGTIDSGQESDLDLSSAWLAPVGVSLSLLSFITFVGNAMVLHAFRVDKRLQTVPNMFIMSLASADLIVGLLVMPLGSLYATKGEWTLGVTTCRLWLITDYTASTASILNLCILSLDRYWSITTPLQYLRRRTKRRALAMISSVWLLSSSWVWPVLLWDKAATTAESTSTALTPSTTAVTSSNVSLLSDQESPPDLRQPIRCETAFAANWYFKLVTATLNFYIPWLWMMFLYTRMFAVIRRRSQMEVGRFNQGTGCQSLRSNNNSRSHIQRQSRKKKQEVPLNSCCEEATTEFNAPLRRSTRKSSSDSNFMALVTMKSSLQSTATSSDVRKVTMIESPASPLRKISLLGRQRERKAIPVTDENEIYQQNAIRTCSETPTVVSSLPRKSRITRSRTRTTIEAKRTNSQQDFADGAYDDSVKGSVRVERGSRKLCSTPSPANSTNIILQREKKAAIQLSVIMGAFVLCWLPYSVLFVVVADCGSCVPQWIYTASIWLGYLNSALNPILYPLCNATFKQAFKNILTRQHSDSARSMKSRDNIRAANPKL